jgi:hypothetical protein
MFNDLHIVVWHEEFSNKESADYNDSEAEYPANFREKAKANGVHESNPSIWIIIIPKQWL